VSRLLQRAALVGLGGYLLAIALVGSSVILHPESFVHFTPLQAFGIEAVLKIATFVGVSTGAAAGFFLVRSRSVHLPAKWLLPCGALVVLLARWSPSIPAFLGACPVSDACDPYHWSMPLELLLEPLLALSAVAILATFARSSAVTPPNKSLERTRDR
jgi:hypothetical protein